jgi:hypothetical protein
MTKRWILPTAWYVLALAHASFFWSLCSGMEGIDTGIVVRGAGLLLAIAYCLVEATGRGLLSAQVLNEPRRLLAFWVVVAALHTGVPFRYVESPVDLSHDRAHGAMAVLMGAMGVAVATGAMQTASLAREALGGRDVFPVEWLGVCFVTRPLMVYLASWDGCEARGGHAREWFWLLGHQQLSPPLR